MAEEYLQEVELPSKGRYYGDSVPDGVVAIEPLGTREDKLLASAKEGNAVLDKIFDNCVTCPIPHVNLLVGDRLHLLIRLRSISYGSSYYFHYRCPSCRKTVEGHVNLDKLDIKEVSDDVDPGSDPSFEVTLPLKGDTVRIRLMTALDEDKIQQYIRRLKKTAPDMDPSSQEYVYRLARRLTEINGEPAGIRQAIEYVESIKGKDSLEIQYAIEENEVGPVTEVEPTCSNCGYEAPPFPMPIAGEFFRPARRRSRPGAHIKTAEAVDAT
ncbi:MAG: hypothetical protein MJA83_03400 [Gammaproteobacteria bacterium]|nr:hypothetical protein [Gammaproteobacteria bacterium]